ncbi:hypothetical protein [Actinobacillus porcinus]|uniref:hypothetical protein n=1 Tax=Actinobacillus porcinus TaxID=51048 RepID=UPI002A90B9C2|nr:hypothetical protein [Actinobacillus porcinus]MDY6217081.1 hypothetical protein [Actinobacillus porcinus]
MSNSYERGREDGFKAFRGKKLTSMELNTQYDDYVEGYINALCEMYINRSTLEATVDLEDLKEYYKSVSRAIPIIQSYLDDLL